MYRKRSNKKPQLKRVIDPILNADAFYLLPTRLLMASLKVLAIANSGRDAVLDVTYEDDSAQSSNPAERRTSRS